MQSDASTTVVSKCGLALFVGSDTAWTFALSARQHAPYVLTQALGLHQSCILLQAASRQIAKQASIMDAQLFTIKQLLILREQIAPFEADFAVTEYDLDFSHMRDHLRRIMAGMFCLTTQHSASNIFAFPIHSRVLPG